MPTYTFWYSETYTNKGWFTADNLEHAKKLLEEIEQGEASFDELTDWGYKDKGYDLDIDPVSIEEID